MQKSPIELMLEKHKPKNMVETMFGFNSNVSAGVLNTYIDSIVRFEMKNKNITFPGSNLFRSVIYSKSYFTGTD